MNRAEKRRQRKLAQIAARKSKPAGPEIPAAGHALETALRHHRQGRLSEAEAVYRAVLQTDPEQPVALHLLGLIAHRRGNFDAAAGFIGKALAVKPDNSDAHNDLGNALKGLGRLDEAAASYRRALAIAPQYTEAHNNLGNALRGRGRLDEAVASYHRALAIKPDYAEVQSNLGNALLDFGKPDEAAARYRSALAIKPGYVAAHNNLGNALKGQGPLDEAAASYRKALQLDPGFGDAHHNLHALQLDGGDMAGAVKFMQCAVGIDPDRADYRFILGMLLDYRGDPAAAEPHFEAAEKGPSPVRATIDAWRYIKSAGAKIPRLTGSSVRTLELALGAAANEGLVLEFGVRFSTSIRTIAALVEQKIHGFDSFEGLPEAWHGEAKGAYSTGGELPSVPDNVMLHDGWFEETLPGFIAEHPAPIRFMNIDCDIYSSTRTVLNLLAKQIVPGTVIVFDENIGNENWREDEFKAFQEAVAEQGWNYEYLYFSFMTKQVVVRINRSGPDSI